MLNDAVVLESHVTPTEGWTVIDHIWRFTSPNTSVWEVNQEVYTLYPDQVGTWKIDYTAFQESLDGTIEYGNYIGIIEVTT